MDISLFDYRLPQELIAQESVEPRDHSRLLILDRFSGKTEDKIFYEIIDYLSSNDIIVFNDTKVVPARLFGKKIETSGKAEILLLRPKNRNFFDFQNWPKEWIAIGKPEMKINQEIQFGDEFKARVIEKNGYEMTIAFNQEGEQLKERIVKFNQTPIPPYIKNPTNKSFQNYQTVFAKKEGSVAAPTAGFHFTEKLLEKIQKKGVQMEFITLHIGLGTFLPVKEKEIEKHKMHSEYFILPPETANRLNSAKKENKRIIAVGTTVTRVLESCLNKSGFLIPKQGWTELFIYPGYHFKFTNALITNFHLPKSTLLMLVSTFADRELILKAYQEAIDKKYRFFSFGDAMLIK